MYSNRFVQFIHFTSKVLVKCCCSNCQLDGYSWELHFAELAGLPDVRITVLFYHTPTYEIEYNETRYPFELTDVSCDFDPEVEEDRTLEQAQEHIKDAFLLRLQEHFTII